MKRILISSSAIFVGAFFLGCQTMPYQPYARSVKVEPESGGVVALKLEHRDEDRTKAQSMMTQNCGTIPVKIMEEGEAVIGTETNAKETNQDATEGTKVGSLFGMPLTTGGTEASKNTASVTTQKKEWQIRYKCLTAVDKPKKRVTR